MIKISGVKEAKTLSLFPDLTAKIENDRFMRDEIHLAKYPLCVFSKTKPDSIVTFRPRPDVEVALISNPEADSQIPRGRHLDYLYAMLYLLAERTHYTFNRNTILFYATEALNVANKLRNAEEYRTLYEAIHYYRWMGIKSTVLKTIFGNDVKQITDVVSIIQNYTIINGARKGRKKDYEVDPSGYYKVVFSDFIMDNLRSIEMSKKLNFSFMMKLSSPICKRYYRLLDVWKYEESVASHPQVRVEREISDIAWQLPLANHKDPSIIRRTIDPLHKELIDLKYLHNVEYVRRSGRMRVAFCFSEFTTEQAVIYTELMQRDVNETVARAVALNDDPYQVMEVIRYYDFKKKEKNVNAAYLYSILKSPNWESIRKCLEEQDKREVASKAEKDSQRKNKMIMVYLQHIESKIDETLSALSEKEQKEIRKLAKTKVEGQPRITARSYEISVDMAIREIIQAQMKIPHFDDWYISNKNLLEQCCL
jgi:hypothetical protein